MTRRADLLAELRRPRDHIGVIACRPDKVRSAQKLIRDHAHDPAMWRVDETLHVPMHGIFVMPASFELDIS